MLTVGGCGNPTTDALEDIWDDASSEEQALMCQNINLFGAQMIVGLVTEDAGEELPEDWDPEEAVDWFQDKCD